MEKKEIKEKTLEMIQGIISRLAGNSFAIKGFAITMIAAIIALDKIYYSYLFLVLILWFLDSFYLSLERNYRNLYNSTRLGLVDEEYNLSLYKESFKRLREVIKTGKTAETLRNTNILVCMLSTTELFFYSPLLLLIYFSK